jgi:GntR family transcriptional regulator
VIPFRVHFRPGISLYEQVVYAATKAIIAGQLRPGEVFPSVRTLSKELKINPNTAHKVVGQLASAGLLETRPGVGTVVAALPESSPAERTNLLGSDIEELVVEAKRLGIELEDVLRAVSAHWQRLTSADDSSAGPGREGKGRR